MNSKIRTYTELSKLDNLEDRFNYLKINGIVGDDTFGFDRYINQKFYQSKEWKNTRNYVIARDMGNNMGLPNNEINGKIYVHHMNTINVDDIKNSSDYLLNPEYLVCVSEDTHNAIHYGDISLIKKNDILDRKPNDTCPWK